MLTTKQQIIFDYLVEYIQKYGKSPTIQQICDNFGYKSKRNATQYLEALEKKGYIERSFSEYRGIKLMTSDNRNQTVNIPILGYANCGMPISPDYRV